MRRRGTTASEKEDRGAEGSKECTAGERGTGSREEGGQKGQGKQGARVRRCRGRRGAQRAAGEGWTQGIGEDRAAGTEGKGQGKAGQTEAGGKAQGEVGGGGYMGAPVYPGVGGGGWWGGVIPPAIPPFPRLPYPAVVPVSPPPKPM